MRTLAGEVTTRSRNWWKESVSSIGCYNNLLKMYDKFGEVLRLETLLRDVRDFKVYRTKEKIPTGRWLIAACAKAWRICTNVRR